MVEGSRVSLRSTGPKPCIPPISAIPFIFFLLHCSEDHAGGRGRAVPIIASRVTSSQLVLAPAVRSGRPHRQDEVANFGVAVVDAHLDLVGNSRPNSASGLPAARSRSVNDQASGTRSAAEQWPTLGLPPTWYKSPAYRSRIVIEPRSVLAEFGLEIPDEVEVRVYDSNAEIRYLVLPMRPAGTDGWSEDKLAELVTRDAMIGTALPRPPA